MGDIRSPQSGHVTLSPSSVPQSETKQLCRAILRRPPGPAPAPRPPAHPSEAQPGPRQNSPGSVPAACSSSFVHLLLDDLSRVGAAASFCLGLCSRRESASTLRSGAGNAISWAAWEAQRAPLCFSPSPILGPQIFPKGGSREKSPDPGLPPLRAPQRLEVFQASSPRAGGHCPRAITNIS